MAVDRRWAWRTSWYAPSTPLMVELVWAGWRALVTRPGIRLCPVDCAFWELASWRASAVVSDWSHHIHIYNAHGRIRPATDDHGLAPDNCRLAIAAAAAADADARVYHLPIYRRRRSRRRPIQVISYRPVHQAAASTRILNRRFILYSTPISTFLKTPPACLYSVVDLCLIFLYADYGQLDQVQQVRIRWPRSRKLERPGRVCINCCQILTKYTTN